MLVSQSCILSGQVKNNYIMVNTFDNDKRAVLTLDAGGTNFVFSAIQGNREIIEPINKKAYPDDLEKCLSMVMNGFKEVAEKISVKASAISFAFPGPADYEKGIIGILPNFPAFRGGVPLGPMLEDEFKIPVFIDNDGSLFAYGEALAGYLPMLNKKIREAGGIKQYKNLVGLTLGTGFGGGIVVRGQLMTGDNSCGAEVHNTLNAYYPDWNAEESISTRAIQHVYSDKAGMPFNAELMPKDVYDIATGKKEGSRKAAVESFRQFGIGLGNAIANIVSLVDGIVVLGGGLTAAWDMFAPVMFSELNRQYINFRGIPSPRLSFKIYNLEDDSVFREFAMGKITEITVPGSSRRILYDDLPRTGVGLSKLGASKAIWLGAYAYALQKMG
jgi:glucokinase